jgi:hypothetical protein
MSVTIRLTHACCLLAVLVAGCQTSTVSVKSGTPTPVSALALFTQHACTSWEPPEATITSPPANGAVAIIPNKFTIDAENHPCRGKTVDRTLVVYTSKANFRGQDRFTVQYNYINNDGGGRASKSEDVTVNVQ